MHLPSAYFPTDVYNETCKYREETIRPANLLRLLERTKSGSVPAAWIASADSREILSFLPSHIPIGICPPLPTNCPAAFCHLS